MYILEFSEDKCNRIDQPEGKIESAECIGDGVMLYAYDRERLIVTGRDYEHVRKHLLAYFRKHNEDFVAFMYAEWMDECPNK